MEIPKRRKYKDNPYTLEVIDNKNYLKFKDNKNELHIVEISIEVQNVFNASELQDLKQMNEFDNHIEHSSLLESTLHKRAIDISISIEEEVEKKMKNEELYIAISKLSETQKRRIKMYYFEDKTLKEIATIEGCSIKNIHKSITQSIEKLQKFLKK